MWSGLLVCVSVVAGLSSVRVETAPSQRRALPAVVNCPLPGYMDVLIDRPTEQRVVMRPAQSVDCQILFNNKAYKLERWTFDTEPVEYPSITDELEDKIAAGSVRGLQIRAELSPVDRASADYESISSVGLIWAGDLAATDDEEPLPIPPVGATGVPVQLPVEPERRRLFLKALPKTVQEHAIDLALIKEQGAEKPRVTLFYEEALEASDRLNRALHAINAPTITPEQIKQARANAKSAEGVHVTVVRAG